MHLFLRTLCVLVHCYLREKRVIALNVTSEILYRCERSATDHLSCNINTVYSSSSLIYYTVSGEHGRSYILRKVFLILFTFLVKCSYPFSFRF